MGWSWRISTIAGIPVYVHGTFTILIAFLFINGVSQGRGIAAAVAGVLFILAVFVTIVLHELGHALTARHFGIRTRDITLLPIGGVARLERMPDVPRQELWVALAGPAVNLAIAALAFALVVAGTGRPPELGLDPSEVGFVGRFTSINVALAVFNMLPAFPMDGGRALRAILAERIDYVRATEVAASIGQGLALVFGLLGLFTNPFLVFIALFVWMGASGEVSAAGIRGALGGVPVGRAMVTEFRTVEADMPLQQVVTFLMMGGQSDFPVRSGSGGSLVGILSRDQLVEALDRHGGAGLVRDAMTTTFETADVREMLDDAYVRLQASQCPMLPVFDGDHLVGLLTADNVAEYIMIRGALGRGR